MFHESRTSARNLPKRIHLDFAVPFGGSKTPEPPSSPSPTAETGRPGVGYRCVDGVLPRSAEGSRVARGEGSVEVVACVVWMKVLECSSKHFGGLESRKKENGVRMFKKVDGNKLP